MTWQPATPVSALDENFPTPCTIGGIPVAVYLVDGKVCATANRCTHGTALLSDGFHEGGVVECPLHQGRFDIATGKALCEPLTEDLKVYPAEVREDVVWINVGE